jgi:hypothetical protein
VRRFALPVAAAVSAFAAHALIYGTLRPADPAHAYFAWYGRVCLAGLVVLVALAALGRRVPLPAPSARSLVPAAYLVLLAQESFELHRLAAPTPSQLLLMLAAVTVASLALISGLRAVRAVVASRPGPVAYGARPSWTPVVSAAPAALACRAVSLRGPPSR